MKIKQLLSVSLGLAIISCSSNKRTSEVNDQILGDYAREYSFNVTNPENGQEIGISTVRDTIFIRQKQNEYEVSNNRWRLNDYDKDGWKNLEHSEDRPLPTYNAAFDPTDNSLNAELMTTLFFDPKEAKLYLGKKSNSPYKKVQ